MGGLGWKLREKAGFQPVATAARERHVAKAATGHLLIVYERPTVLSDRGAEADAKRDAQAGELVSAPSCEGRPLIIDTASSGAELVKLLRAHDLAECAACASTRGTVAADRLHVSPVAVCCEGMAAQ